MRVLPMRSYPIFEGRPRPLVMAHRGSSRAAPENTLASFRRAFAEKTDILETDIHVTADGEFVLIHDATLERTTGEEGPVSDRTSAELRRIRANRGFGGFADETIPMLDDLLAILPSDTALVLELKSDTFLETEVLTKLLGLLERARVLDRCGVISFSEARLRALKRHAPAIPAGLISLSRGWPPSGLEMTGPFWPFLVMNPLYVPIAHARNMLVAPLDPAPHSRLWLYRLLGCDAVLTDDPAETRRLLFRRQGRDDSRGGA